MALRGPREGHPQQRGSSKGKARLAGLGRNRAFARKEKGGIGGPLSRIHHIAETKLSESTIICMVQSKNTLCGQLCDGPGLSRQVPNHAMFAR